MPLSDALLGELDHEMASTRRHLERVPDGQLAWRPHPRSMTLGALASHLADLPGYAIHAVRGSEYDLAPPGAPPPPPASYRSVAELVSRFDAVLAEARQAMAATADGQWMAPWTLKGGGKPIFTLPRIAVVRSLVLNHAIHHRAQLGVYLRLLDVPVPSTYGPTADE